MLEHVPLSVLLSSRHFGDTWLVGRSTPLQCSSCGVPRQNRETTNCCNVERAEEDESVPLSTSTRARQQEKGRRSHLEVSEERRCPPYESGMCLIRFGLRIKKPYTL